MSLGGLGRGRGKRRLNAEVNIINLVDVVLVLLIIFMITAPMMQGAIAVQLPRAVAAPPNSSDVMKVTIFKDGRARVGDGTGYISVSEVVATYKRMYQSNSKLSVNIFSDKHAEMGQVTAMLDALRQAGVSQANFITTLGGN